jgi:endonuclease III
VARESVASRSKRAGAVAKALASAYPLSTCALAHETPFQLLVATVLSAQTTDLAVNRVTPGLFRRYPDAAAMAQAREEDVARLVNSIGLWRAKARSVHALSRILVAEHGGEVPRSLEELMDLPGVGRKTATAVLGQAFGMAAGVTVDTHMLRVNRLLRLSAARDPEAMAADLERLLPPGQWTAYTHRIIDHGRLVCVARRPRCGVCPLATLCPSAFKASAGYKPANDEREPASAGGLSWKRTGLPGMPGRPAESPRQGPE